MDHNYCVQATLLCAAGSGRIGGEKLGGMEVCSEEKRFENSSVVRRSIKCVNQRESSHGSRKVTVQGTEIEKVDHFR